MRLHPNVNKNVKSSIFYRLHLKTINFYNWVWTSIYSLNCKFKGHILDTHRSEGHLTLVFCTRRGCKFSQVKAPSGAD